jgi:hypothetical protein
VVGVGQLAGEDVQTEILQRLTRVETKLDMQINAKDMAAEALNLAKRAHERIEETNRFLGNFDKHYDGEVKALSVKIDTENEKRRAGQRWLVGTILSACALCITVILKFV